MGIPKKDSCTTNKKKKVENVGERRMQKEKEGRKGEEKEDEILSWLSQRDKRNPIGNGG